MRCDPWSLLLFASFIPFQQLDISSTQEVDIEYLYIFDFDFLLDIYKELRS